MKVLCACECSGKVRDAFLARGHDAISCDLKPSEKEGPHHQGDVLEFLAGKQFDLMIAHPPCTYLARVSSPELKKDPSRLQKMEEGLKFFHALWELNIPYICLENPYPMRHTKLWPPAQVIHPYYFGDPWLKATCLWLKGLPPLRITDPRLEVHSDDPAIRPFRLTKAGLPYVNPSSKAIVKKYNKYSWVTAMKNHRSPTARARTFPGIAAAMAEQWGSLRRPYGFFS